MQEEKYMALVDKEKDDHKDLYAAVRFQPQFIERFRFVVLSSSREQLAAEWFKKFYSIEVLMKDGKSFE